MKNAFIFALCVSISACTSTGNQNFSTSIIYEPDQVPWIRITTDTVHGQCQTMMPSVFVSSSYPYKFRVAVLKQKEQDEIIYYVLDNKTSRKWIGCANDGYSYSIKSAEMLPSWQNRTLIIQAMTHSIKGQVLEIGAASDTLFLKSSGATRDYSQAHPKRVLPTGGSPRKNLNHRRSRGENNATDPPSQIDINPRTPSAAMSFPRPRWMISPRSITRYWSASSAAKS